MSRVGRRSGRLGSALLAAGAVVVSVAGCSGGGGTNRPTGSAAESSQTARFADSAVMELLKDEQEAVRIMSVMATVRLPRDFVADDSWMAQLGHDCRSWHYFGCWRSPDSVERTAQALKTAVDSSGVESQVPVYCYKGPACTVTVRTPAGLATYHVLSNLSAAGSLVYGFVTPSSSATLGSSTPSSQGHAAP